MIRLFQCNNTLTSNYCHSLKFRHESSSQFQVWPELTGPLKEGTLIKSVLLSSIFAIKTFFLFSEQARALTSAGARLTHWARSRLSRRAA